MIAGMLATIGSVLLLLWAASCLTAAGWMGCWTHWWFQEGDRDMVSAGLILTTLFALLGLLAFRLWWR